MSAHVAVVLYGSRGDIQPGLALALELEARGHRVSVALPPNLAGLAIEVGLHTIEIGLDTHTAWSSPEAEAVRGSHGLARARFALATVRRGFTAFDHSLAAEFVDPGARLSDVDLIVAAPLCQDRCLALSEHLGTSLVVLRFAPMSHNSVFGAIPGLTDSWSAEWKRRSWRVTDRLTWLATGWNENRFRRRLGLPRARGPLPERMQQAGIVAIQAYDREIEPRLESEWGATKPIVGFMDLPRRSRVGISETSGEGTDLAEWLDAGTPPVFVTVGSMSIAEPVATLDMIVRAVRGTGQRCLLSATDYDGVGRSDPDVFVVGALDHAAVLPRCRAAIHHGGAGTTGATLRAGLPTMVCAVTAEQPFWAARVTALGVGVGRRLASLTGDDCATGVAVLTSRSTRETARELASRMTDPREAVDAAAQICEAHLSRSLAPA